MDSKRPKLDGPNVPVLSNKYDRFCTNCSSIIENAALEKFKGKQCSQCYKDVEFRDVYDGFWRRCVHCDVFIRCTFKHCYMCSRSNAFYEPLREEQMKSRALFKLRHFRLHPNLKMAMISPPSLETQTISKSSGEKPCHKADKTVVLSDPHVPEWQEKFDRYCTNCTGIIKDCALEKYERQHCQSCNVIVEYRLLPDNDWSRCVRCDTFVKCTFKYCYFCRRPNQNYDPAVIEKVRREIEKDLNEILDQEERDMASLADSIEETASQSMGNVDETGDGETSSDLPKSKSANTETTEGKIETE